MVGEEEEAEGQAGSGASRGAADSKARTQLTQMGWEKNTLTKRMQNYTISADVKHKKTQAIARAKILFERFLRNICSIRKQELKNHRRFTL